MILPSFKLTEAEWAAYLEQLVISTTKFNIGYFRTGDFAKMIATHKEGWVYYLDEFPKRNYPQLDPDVPLLHVHKIDDKGIVEFFNHAIQGKTLDAFDPLKIWRWQPGYNDMATINSIASRGVDLVTYKKHRFQFRSVVQFLGHRGDKPGFVATINGIGTTDIHRFESPEQELSAARACLEEAVAMILADEKRQEERNKAYDAWDKVDGTYKRLRRLINKYEAAVKNAKSDGKRAQAQGRLDHYRRKVQPLREQLQKLN